MLSQKAVTAYFSSKQQMPLGLAWQLCYHTSRRMWWFSIYLSVDPKSAVNKWLELTKGGGGGADKSAPHMLSIPIFNTPHKLNSIELELYSIANE